MATIKDTVMALAGPIQHKRGTLAALKASDYVPAPGEILVATDTGFIKVGDGVHTWSELPQSDATEIAANYTETVEGKALDATMGKDLNERLAEVEGISGIDCGEISVEEPGTGE